MITVGTNQIGDDACSVIAKILSENSNLRELHMDGGEIGDKGTTVLAQALEKNNKLEKLYLGNLRVRW